MADHSPQNPPFKRFGIQLELNFTDTAPNGPGWYVWSFTDDRLLVPPAEVSHGGVYALIELFRTVLQSTESAPSVDLMELMRQGDSLMKQMIEQQLAEAQRHAARIGMLKQKLAQVDGDDAQS